MPGSTGGCRSRRRRSDLRPPVHRDRGIVAAFAWLQQKVTRDARDRDCRDVAAIAASGGLRAAAIRWSPQVAAHLAGRAIPPAFYHGGRRIGSLFDAGVARDIDYCHCR